MFLSARGGSTDRSFSHICVFALTHLVAMTQKYITLANESLLAHAMRSSVVFIFTSHYN